MERRGIATERGDQHRERLAMNAQIIELAEVRKALEVERQAEQDEPPALTHRERVHAAVAEVMRRQFEEQFRTPSKQPTAPESTRPDPQAIKQAWRQEEQIHFGQIVERAKRIQNQAFGQWQRQEQKLDKHDQLMPQRPQGLLAG